MLILVDLSLDICQDYSTFRFKKIHISLRLYVYYASCITPYILYFTRVLRKIHRRNYKTIWVTATRIISFRHTIFFAVWSRSTKRRFKESNLIEPSGQKRELLSSLNKLVSIFLPNNVFFIALYSRYFVRLIHLNKRRYPTKSLKWP